MAAVIYGRHFSSLEIVTW